MLKTFLKGCIKFLNQNNSGSSWYKTKLAKGNFMQGRDKRDMLRKDKSIDDVMEEALKVLYGVSKRALAEEEKNSHQDVL